MPESTTPFLRVLALVALLVASALAPAPQDDGFDAPPPRTELEARRDAAEDAEVEALYTRALEALEEAEAQRSVAEEFEREAAGAPALLTSIQAELAAPPAPVAPDLSSKNLTQLEQALEQALSDRDQARKDVAALVAEGDRRGQRRMAVVSETSGARGALSELEDQLRSAPAGDAPIDEALRAERLARRAALKAKLRALSAEVASYDARAELLPAKRSRAERRVAQADERVAVLTRATDTRRQAEAESARSEAARQLREATESSPELRALAESNEAMAQERTGEAGIAARVARAQTAAQASAQGRADLARRFAQTRRKLRVAGLTDAMGVELLRELSDLPDPRLLEREAEVRRREISDVQYAQILAQEEGERIGRELAALSEAEATAEGALRRQLLESRRRINDARIEGYGSLYEALARQQVLEQERLEIVRAYREAIEARILWMRSVVGGSIPRLGVMGAALGWLADPRDWIDAARVGLHGLGERPGAALFLLLLLTLSLATHGVLRRALAEADEAVRRYKTDSFGQTLRALGVTVVLAARLPVCLWILGWFLATPPEQNGLGVAVGRAFERGAWHLFGLEAGRLLVRKQGLGDGHFRWPTAVRQNIKRNLRLLFAFGFPAMLVTLIYEDQLAEWRDSIGRIAFIVAMAALALFLWRVLRADGPLRGELQRDGRDGLLNRFASLWFPLFGGVPVVLALASALGYVYTAQRFSEHFRLTLIFVVVVVLLDALLRRWLFLTRRRLAIEQARQRAARAQEASDGGEAMRESGNLDEDHVDIPQVGAQTMQLFRSAVTLIMVLGLYAIWSPTLPALTIFERVQVWPDLAIVSAFEAEGAEEVPEEVERYLSSPDPEAPTSEVQGEGEPDSTGVALPGMPATQESLLGLPNHVITLADVILALLLLLLTVIAARNLPGLIEIGLLQKLPLDGGARNAIATLARYGIGAVGITAIFGAVGIGWSQIQWLAAALTFGLAFGLQEIFANFVSGLIILIERPVRIGDLVTVAGVEGRVTRLHMRATTILDYDRRELLVPNKEFITGSLINWTLSDPVTRVVIPVGVAYGSDTRRVHELLRAAAAAQPNVLSDPAPSSVFRRFGDSSLDFELRVFLPERDFWPQVVDGLHLAIDDDFRKAGVEIAFPQLDVHVHSGLEEVVD